MWTFLSNLLEKKAAEESMLYHNQKSRVANRSKRQKVSGMCQSHPNTSLFLVEKQLSGRYSGVGGVNRSLVLFQNTWQANFTPKGLAIYSFAKCSIFQWRANNSLSPSAHCCSALLALGASGPLVSSFDFALPHQMPSWALSLLQGSSMLVFPFLHSC